MTNATRWSGALLAIPLLAVSALLGAFDLKTRQHQAYVPLDTSYQNAITPAESQEKVPQPFAWLLGGAALLVGLTITTIRAPNKPVPVNSYAANVAILESDGGAVSVPLPAALSDILANYNGPATPATNLQLKFTLTCLVGTGAAVTVVYDSSTSPGSLTITQGAAAAAEFYVEVAVPTTNNAP